MVNAVKRVDKNPKDYGPLRPAIVNVAKKMVKINPKKEMSVMYVEKSSAEVIVLEEEVKLAGMSLLSEGTEDIGNIPEEGGRLWGEWHWAGGNTDEILSKIKNVKYPRMCYGVSLSDMPGSPHIAGRGAANDYFVGTEVTEYDTMDKRFAALTLPAGRYIKYTFNARDFEELVTGRLYAAFNNGGKWAEENNLAIDEDKMFFVEAYPHDKVRIGYENGPEWGLDLAKIETEEQYPEMFLLFPVKE